MSSTLISVKLYFLNLISSLLKSRKVRILTLARRCRNLSICLARNYKLTYLRLKEHKLLKAMYCMFIDFCKFLRSSASIIKLIQRKVLVLDESNQILTIVQEFLMKYLMSQEVPDKK